MLTGGEDGFGEDGVGDDQNDASELKRKEVEGRFGANCAKPWAIDPRRGCAMVNLDKYWPQEFAWEGDAELERQFEALGYTFSKSSGADNSNSNKMDSLILARDFYCGEKTDKPRLRLCDFCWTEAKYLDPKTQQPYCSIACQMRLKQNRDPQLQELGLAKSKEEFLKKYKEFVTGYE